MIVKLGEKAHLQSIMDGTIRFAPLQAYIKMEKELQVYYDVAEPPARCGESHLTGLTDTFDAH